MGARGLLKALKPIIGWHGTPHYFDKFEFSPRTRKTGEGAELITPGTYIGGVRKTGEHYREQLAGRPVPARLAIEGETVYAKMTPYQKDAYMELHPRLSAYKAWHAGLGPDDDLMAEQTGALSRTLNNIKNGDVTVSDFELRQLMAAHDLMQSKRVVVKPPSQPGHLLETAIHADPETDLIDWDNSAIEQPAILEKLGLTVDDFDYEPDKASLYSPASMMRRKYTDGQGLWDGAVEDEVQKLRAREGMPIARDVVVPEALIPATETLKAKGIVGVKFLDQLSRSAGHGTHNYAIWDDRVLEILKRYGLPLTSAGVATLAAALNDQQETA